MSSLNGASAERGGILVILPRGEAIRNVVYSGALARIRQELPVTALSVEPNEHITDLIREQSTRFIALVRRPERWIVGVQRQILDIAHGRYIWSEAAKARWQVRNDEATSLPAKAKLWAQRAAALPFVHQPGLRTLSGLEGLSSQWFRADNHYRDLMRELQPRLVFNASHVHSTLAIQAVHAARAESIPTAAFLFSWDNLTSQGRIIPPYDYYLAWSAEIRDQLLGMYPFVPGENAFVTGTPQFDTHFLPDYEWPRDRLFKEIGADCARPLVLYTTGMANHMPGEHHVVAQIADMLGELPSRPQLAVRVYAKDTTGRFDGVRDARPDIHFVAPRWESNWLTPTPEDAALYANLLRHCDLGINIASTVSLELCMFDKPVLNVAYPPPGPERPPVPFARFYRFDHYAPVVASGAVEVVKEKAAMPEALERALGDPTERSANRKALVEQMFGGQTDGRCGERLAEKLLEIARS